MKRLTWPSTMLVQTDLKSSLDLSQDEICDIYRKLQKLEDIEEKYNIDLTQYHKSSIISKIKNPKSVHGCWARPIGTYAYIYANPNYFMNDENARFKYGPNYFIIETLAPDDGLYMWYGTYFLEDYGITWALSEEELSGNI
jgi:hypothetical protein